MARERQPSELFALKSSTVFLCMRPDGEIRAGPASGEGLYAQDTRHLSELRLTIGGHAPPLLSSGMPSAHRAVVEGANPELHVAGAPSVGQHTLAVRRTVLVADRLHYRIEIESFRPHAVRTTVELSLAADFADVFEARGYGRRTTGSALAPAASGADLRFAYLAADGDLRETLVAFDPPPARVDPGDGDAHIAWDVEIAGRSAIELLVTVEAVHGARLPAAPSLEHADAELDAAQRDWVASCTRIATGSALVDRVVDASMRDLHALMMPLGDFELPAAGIPWYVAPFGRDALLAACAALVVDPGVARGTLLALASLQAREDDPWRDAEPGKILHELRTGELARTGRMPHSPYYGTVDATPLFLMVAGAYYDWTLDLPAMVTLRPALDAALGWIDDWGDRDGDGFVEYECRSPAGLPNQGWKDSEDCIVHADGSLAQGPIALVEVQGYVYAAKRAIARVYDALGEPARAAGLRAQAATLRAAFNDAFWNAEEQFFALALDGRKAQVASVTSNPAHCLYCGIADDDKARTVAERLMAPDMFSGWGIRTLSSESPAYNPMSYHNGSVWPHDNAIAAAGLKRYGLDADAARIAGAMFDVASGARDHRLPELFCGFERDASRAIVSYPVACVPQAWAATAPFMLLQALLGVGAQAPDNRLRIDRPQVPEWLGRTELRDVRVGGSLVSLSFRGTPA